MIRNRLEEAVARELFRQDPISVAKQLLGMEIVRKYGEREVRGRILEVSAWQGTHGDYIKPKFDDYKPGQLSVSTKYGKHLMDITVEDGNSCITLINGEFEFGGQLFRPEGPGKLAKAFQVDPSFDGLDLATSDALYLAGTPVDPEQILQRNKKNTPPNCRGYFYIRPSSEVVRGA